MKQRIYVVSFAHNCCEKAQKNLKETALKHGASKVFSLNLDTLEAPADVKEYIKNNKRGAGYWIWKPYAIKQVLSGIRPNDIVIYVDASTYFENSMQHIINEINKNSILCFDTGYHKQNAWTKMNAVNHFGYQNDWCTTDGVKFQFMATLLGIKNDTLGNTIVNKWLDVLIPSNSHLFDDSNTPGGNCKQFIESRHDQQMLSLILYKYVPHIKFPAYDKKKYGWVFHQNINGNDRHV